MKKIFLLLILLIGYVGVGWAQNYIRSYDFSQTNIGEWDEATLMDDENAKFTVNLPNGGFNNGFGADELEVKVMSFTINGTNPQRFAFNDMQTWNKWHYNGPGLENGAYMNPWNVTPGDNDASRIKSLKNQCGLNNIFSVLNLRAGEIVRIKSFDAMGETGNPSELLKNRFIIEHSPNAIDNAPWENGGNGTKNILEATQEFIMTADGNLDLKVAPWLKILTIDIISNYKYFEQRRAHVGTPIEVDIPNRKNAGDEDLPNKVNHSGWYRWNNQTNSSQQLGNVPNNPTSVSDLKEYYSGSLNWVGNDGHLIWNVTEGLEPGNYRVEVYATSHNTPNNGVENANFTDGANDVAYVYANGGQGEQKQFFPIWHNSGFNTQYEPYVCTFDNITVTNDGRLELGMGMANSGGKTNWHCIQIKSLTKLGTGQGAGEYVQYEPVVLYYGDLTPGTVETTKNQNADWHIKISDFSGKQSNSGYWEGGAIIVMLDQHMYTFTVPYNVNKSGNANFAAWNFWQNPLKIGRSDQPVYKSLLSHDIAEGTFHNVMFMNTENSQTGLPDEPMFRYKYKMNGQNAYYNPETAGLIFQADPAVNDGFYGVLNESIGYDTNTQSSTHGQIVIPDEDKRDDLYGTRYIGLNRGQSFIVPELEEGDEVWVYIDHFGEADQAHMGQTSLGMKIWNAKDALGKTIEDGELIVFGGSTWGPAYFSSNKEAKTYVGAMHFYARGEQLEGMEKGDMKFEITGRNNFCFAKVAYVRIVKHNPQNIISRTTEILQYNGGNKDIKGYEFLTTQKADGSYEELPTGSFMLHDGARGAINQTFEIIEASGTLSKEELNAHNLKRDPSTLEETDTSIDGVIGTYMAYSNKDNHAVGRRYRYTPEAKPNFGSFTLRGMDWDRSGKYCIEYSDRVISVGFRQTMNYPYTWDFTDILNANTGNSQPEYNAAFDRVRPEDAIQTSNNDGMVDTTAVWVNTDGIVSLQNNRVIGQNNRTLCSGTQLFANDTYIEEAAGIGFATINMDYGFNNSIQILPAGDYKWGKNSNQKTAINGGVKFQTWNGWDHRIFVPEIKQTGRLYLRGWKLNNGKGFVLKALKERPMGPNTMKNRTDSRVLFTPLIGDYETVSLFNYEANFGNLIEGQQDITENKVYDDNLSLIKGNDSMEERLGSDRTVNNPANTYDEAGYAGRITVDEQTAYEYDDDLNVIGSKTVYIVTSDNNVYLDDFSTIGKEVAADKLDFKDKAVFDNGLCTGNAALCTSIGDEPITNFVYNNFLYTGAADGVQSTGYLELTLPGDAGYKVTIVARSQSSRQINVFANSWSTSSASALATMVVQNNLSAKSFNVAAGTTKLCIGSDKGSVEIYAIYVEDERSANAAAPTEWAGYVDVTASSSNPTGVTIYLNDIIIEKMSYSTDVKELNIIGWASESRDHFIDHSLTEYFTTDPVKAYLATGTATGQNGLINAVKIEEVTMPMELSEGNGSKTGCIMYNTNNTAATDEAGLYLFVPDIHGYLKADYITNTNFKGDACTNKAGNSANADPEKINAMGDNYMIANLSGEVVEWSDHRQNDVNDINYILAWQFTDGQGVQHPTADETPEERFVRVGHYAQGNGKYGATAKRNSAYLQMPKNMVKPANWDDNILSNMIILFEGEEQSEIDGIEEISLKDIEGESTQQGTDSYYTLSGQKVSTPNKPGIYVKNGKKVYVK